MGQSYLAKNVIKQLMREAWAKEDKREELRS